MGIRAAATGRVILEGVKLPAGALLGEPGESFTECVQLARLGWCALAVGTDRHPNRIVTHRDSRCHAVGGGTQDRDAVGTGINDINAAAFGSDNGVDRSPSPQRIAVGAAIYNVRENQAAGRALAVAVEQSAVATARHSASTADRPRRARVPSG